MHKQTSSPPQKINSKICTSILNWVITRTVLSRVKHMLPTKCFFPIYTKGELHCRVTITYHTPLPHFLNSHIYIYHQFEDSLSLLTHPVHGRLMCIKCLPLVLLHELIPEIQMELQMDSSMESKSCQDQNSSTLKSYQSLTVFFANAGNLINKRNKLYHSITSVKPEIICIAEILPKNTSLPVDDCEVQIQGFDCFTNNNKSLCHRGVLIYTKKCLKAVPVNFKELDYREYAYCKLSYKNSGLLHILFIYRSSNSTIENNNNLNSLVSKFSKLSGYLLILGNFNYPTINWATLGTPHNKENCTTKFLTVPQNCFFASACK